jgi:hypothetical protein
MKQTTRITAANAATIQRLFGSGSYSFITGGCAGPRNFSIAIITIVMKSQLHETNVIAMAPSTVAIETHRELRPNIAWVR